MGVWSGRFSNFVRDTKIIEDAFRKLKPYVPEISADYQPDDCGEVKLFHDELGMIVMRSKGQQYTAYHPQFYLRGEERKVRAPSTMIFSKQVLDKVIEKSIR